MVTTEARPVHVRYLSRRTGHGGGEGKYVAGNIHGRVQVEASARPSGVPDLTDRYRVLPMGQSSTVAIRPDDLGLRWASESTDAFLLVSDVDVRRLIGLERTFARRLRPAESSTFETESAVAAMFDGFVDDALEAVQGVPSDEVVTELRRIVTAMYRRWPCEHYDVYAMDSQTVAVEIQRSPGEGALLLVCEPEGQALCIVTVKSVSRRARYQDSQMLPDGFIADGMRELAMPERWHHWGGG